MINKPTIDRVIPQIVSWGLLCVLLFCIFVSGQKAMRNDTRMTFDGALYDTLGGQLKRNPFDYSPRRYLLMAKDNMPDTEHAARAMVYLDSPLFKHPPLFSYFIAAAKTIFGDSFVSSRYVPFFFRMLTVLIIFLISKRLFGPYWGFLAALFTASGPVMMLCSQKIWIELPCMFFIYLGFYWLFAGREKEICFFLSAAAFGLAILTKYAAVPSIASGYIFLLLSNYISNRKTMFWWFFMPVMIFSPWLFWNYKVFGAGFFSDIILLNTGGDSDLGVYRLILGSIIAVFSVMAVIAAAVVMKGVIRRKYRSFAKMREGRMWGRALSVSLWISLVVLLALSHKSIIRAFNWEYIPPCTATPDMYINAPKYFYFSHLLEISPLFIFSYISVLFARRWRPEILCLALVAMVFFFFFGLFGYYETRYIVLATPALMLLSVYSIRELAGMADSLDGWKRVLSLFVLTVIVEYALIKTIYFDATVVVKNDFIFF